MTFLASGQAGSPLAVTTDIRYYFYVRYEWDDGKAAVNLRKHGVDFIGPKGHTT